MVANFILGMKFAGSYFKMASRHIVIVVYYIMRKKRTEPSVCHNGYQNQILLRYEMFVIIGQIIPHGSMENSNTFFNSIETYNWEQYSMTFSNS